MAVATSSALKLLLLFLMSGVFTSSRFNSIASTSSSSSSRGGGTEQGGFRPTFITPRSTTTINRKLHHLRTSDSSTASSCHYQTSKLNLEDCVAEIESILDDANISALLSASQRSSVENLRQRINDCQPQSIAIGKSDEGSAMIPTTVMENLENPNNVFIASLYGGLKLRNRNGSMLSECSEVVQEREMSISEVSSSVYVPEEWNALSLENKKNLAGLLSLNNLQQWNFNILEVVECTGGKNVLLLIGWAIMASPHSQQAMSTSLGKDCEELSGEYNFEKHLNLNHITLVNFLRRVESEYNASNKYHNNIHAADVLQTLHSLLSMAVDGITSVLSKIDVFSLLLAAVSHDIAHPGTNNLYQVHALTDLAVIYNDKSVLENMHASKASQVILGTSNANVFESLSPKDSALVRTRMIQAILNTDMSHHFASVSFVDDLVSQLKEEGVHWSDIERTDDIANSISNFMLHLADISNPTKSSELAIYWAECALSEFFVQGDMEIEKNLPISPLCDRNETNLASSQRDFITFVVRPSFDVLGKIIPRVYDEVLPLIDANLKYWESQC